MFTSIPTICFLSKSKSTKNYKILRRVYKFNIVNVFSKDELFINLNENIKFLIIENFNDINDYEEIIKFTKSKYPFTKIISLVYKYDFEQLFTSVDLKIDKVFINNINIIHDVAYEIENLNKFENHSSWIQQLKNMCIDEVKEEYKRFNTQKFQFIKSNETKMRTFLDQTVKSIRKDALPKFDKLDEFDLYDELLFDLYEYYLGLLHYDLNKRMNLLEELSNKFIYKYYANFPENEILRPINKFFIEQLKHYTKDYKLNFRLVTFLELLFDIELKFIGITIKDLTSKKLIKKTNSIIENTIHILMSSSSDKLGNLVNSIDEKYWFLQNYVSSEYNKELSNMEVPISNLTKHLDLQSRLFKSFKNETNTMTQEEFCFMIDFIFQNGFKVKYPKTKIEITKDLKDLKTVTINEYLLINSMYALIENSIEANASIITIVLKTINGSVVIDIKDNGKGLNCSVDDYIFDKNFSYNKPGHYGLGLFLAKNWLESISSKLDFIKKENLMRISIPYNKEICNAV